MFETLSDPLLSLQCVHFPAHKARRNSIGQIGWSVVAAEAAGGRIFLGISDGR